MRNVGHATLKGPPVERPSAGSSFVLGCLQNFSRNQFMRGSK